MTSGAQRYRVIIFRGGALGDCLVTRPVLTAIRAAWPEALVEFVGPRNVLSLMIGPRGAHQMSALDSMEWNAAFARGGELSDAVKEKLSTATHLLSYVHDPEKIFENNLKQYFKGNYLSHSHTPNVGPAWIHFLKPLKQWGIDSLGQPPCVDLTPEAIQSSEKILNEWMLRSPKCVIHPGSGSIKKNWPLHLWEETISRFAEEFEGSLLIVGGEADQKVLDALSRHAETRKIPQLISAPLPLLAAVLSQVDLYVGHDSGISHLAAAVGAKMGLIWGESDHQIWKPAGNVEIINHPPAWPSVEEVILFLSKNLKGK